jgi:sugar phosphate isomerase/epimerase
LRSALNAYSYKYALSRKEMTYEDLVHLAAEMGIDGLDLTVYWLPSEEDEYLLSLKRLAYRNGVEIYNLSIATHLTQLAEAERNADVAHIARWVAIAGKMGAASIRVFCGDVPKGGTEEQCVSWCVEGLKRAAPYAEKAGVMLGLENHGSITERSDRLLEIVRRVGSPALGITLDTGNFKGDPWPQIERCLPFAVNVQVKPQPSDWERVTGILVERGYRGYLALEKESPKKEGLAEIPTSMRKLHGLVRAASV